MPTGYTAKLCEREQSRNEFILSCARAFGACVHQRDDDFNDRPSKRGQSEYHDLRIKEAEARLAKFSKGGLLGEYNEFVDSCIDRARKNQIACAEKAARILKMISDIEAWIPPSSDHVEMKAFMLDQLRRTLKQDANSEYYQSRIDYIAKSNIAEWVNENIEDAKRDIKYHTKEREIERNRIESQNKWIELLYESIGEKL